MKLDSKFATLGAVLAIGGVTSLYFLLDIGWLALGIILGASIIGYVLAAVGAARSAIRFEELMRGWLVGLNTGMNGFLAFILVQLLAGTAAGILAGTAVGLVNLLTVFRPISQSGFYQGVLGWLTWVMPMSWLIVSLGLVFYLFSFFLHAVTVGKVNYLKVQAIGADWKTGTFFIKGGLVSNLNILDTAFNMGNFSFVDYQSGHWYKDHEAGHTLNLAAFGTIFHVIGGLDENLLRRGANAYSERIAESNDTGSSGSNIPMWS